MMALPVVGLITAKPRPARKKPESVSGSVGACAAAPIMRPVSASPPVSVTRIPRRSVSQPAGSDMSTPPRYTAGRNKPIWARERPSSSRSSGASGAMASTDTALSVCAAVTRARRPQRPGSAE
jgi:hypothetical protein